MIGIRNKEAYQYTLIRHHRIIHYIFFRRKWKLAKMKRFPSQRWPFCVVPKPNPRKCNSQWFVCNVYCFWHSFLKIVCVFLRLLEMYIYITNEICLSVCLCVPPHISGTVRPRMMKLCMRNLHMIWKISMEKNFGKIEKKNFRNFSRIFFIAEGRAWRRPKGAKRRVLY